MKFTIEKNIIVENLANVVKAISAKNIIPIINGIKFELEDDGLYLTESDSELTIRSFIPNESINKVDSTGSIIIQSKFILDILRKLPSDLVNFELMDGLKIRISSDNSQYDLNCLDPKEYPSLKLEEKDKPIIIKGELFKGIIGQTSFAISTQELRPLLTGLNFKIVGDVFECIATDSYRLAKKVVSLDMPSEEDINIVIPGKNIIELDKIIVDDENVLTKLHEDATDILTNKQLREQIAECLSIPMQRIRIKGLEKDSKHETKYVLYYIDNIEEQLRETINKNIPDEVSVLSSNSYVDDLEDVILSEVVYDGSEVFAEGSCWVDVHIEFDGEDMGNCSFPCSFNVKLYYDDKNNEYMIDHGTFKVNTDSYYK